MGFEDLLKKRGLRVGQPTELTTTSMLIYGESGAGKSTLAASASKCDDLAPVLVIDTERHTIAYGEHADSERLDIVSVDTWPQLVALVSKVIPEAVRQGEFPYKTVVVDTMDRLQEIILNDEKAAQADGSKPRDGFAAWNRVYEDLTRVLERLQQLGVNVIFLAHADRTENQISGAERVSPKFFGRQSVSMIPPKFDLVGYLKRVGGRDADDDTDPHLRALVTSHPDAETKAPVSGFPPILMAPTMEVINQQLRAAVKTNSTDTGTDTNN